MLNDADEDIERILENRLERGLSPGATRPQFLKKLRSEMEIINDRIHDDVNGKLKKELKDVAKTEAEHSSGMVNKHTPPQVSLTRPPDQILTSVVTSEPFQGKILNEWTESAARDRLDRIENAVKLGLVEGDSNQEIVQRVVGTGVRGHADGVLEMGRHNVASITRTAVTHVTSHAREETYRRSQVIKGVQYIATLDTRTTIRCATLDGQTFEVGRGPRPPQHYACRSTSSPITKSWQELGIDRGELDSSTRASMDGQVPSTTTYDDWLKNNPGRAEEVLGKTRAKLWKTGKIDLEDMVRDASGNKIITLDQLRQNESDVFEAAGLVA